MMSEPVKKRRRTSENRYARPINTDNDDTQIELAACGVIESVTMKNFMCHEHLTADFRENINLVQGRNGSGKSAILTAIVLALGGSARMTNRGSNFKELIKYDKHVAVVQVVIKNEGKDAYKPDEYGSRIIVERKLTDSGSGSYSIKGSNSSQVKSHKKEELKRICDYFNLNVENPLTVLNQDMSRSFLNSSDPKHLYRFFYQATQLQQMTDSYQQLSDCLESSHAIIKDRMACLPKIERELQELKNQYEYCKKVTSKRDKVKDLRRELAWANIIQLEKRIAGLEEMLEEKLSDAERIKSKHATYLEQEQNAVQEWKVKEKEFKNAYSEIRKLKKENEPKTAEQSQAKMKWRNAERETESVKNRIDTLKKEIDLLRETIKKDHTAAQQEWEEQNRQHQIELRSAEVEVQELEQIRKTEDTHLANIQNTIRINLEDRQQLHFEENNKKKSINNLQQELKNLQSKNTNSFTVYGSWVQPLTEKINTAFKRGQFTAKPIGPIGYFIEMKDNDWTHIVETVIGGRISGFCVNNNKDERVLRSLFQGINFGTQQPMVICARFRERHASHLIAKNEVRCDQYRSLWSVMDIKEDVVANLIIDRCQAETILLIPSAREAGNLLKDSRTVPKNCKIAYTLNGDRYFPDPNYKVYSGPGQRNARYLQVSVGERAKEVAKDIQNAHNEAEVVSQRRNEIELELRKLKQEEKQSMQKLRERKAVFQNAHAKFTQLMNQVAPPPPPNVSQLEEDIKTLEATRDEKLESLQELQEIRKVREQEYLAVQKEMEEYRAKIVKLTATGQDLEKHMQMAEERANKVVTAKSAIKEKVRKLEEEKKSVEKAIEADRKTLEERTVLTQENFSPRVETKRSPGEIEKQHNILDKNLKEEQSKYGHPVELSIKLKEKKEKFLTLKGELEDCQNIVTKLKESLKARWSKGMRFRKTLSILVKSGFSGALSTRHLKGKLLFDFEKEMLSIHVMKNNSAEEININSSKKGKAVKYKSDQQEKLAMMSGGERSFSTVAFILSLWEVMHSPVRILDEFDVFMDMIARRQSLDMMISAAKTETQYIYLTPLEVNSPFSSSLHIFRMPDPDRRVVNESNEGEN